MLAAAAHLVTPPQRKRLESVSEIVPPRAPPYLDVAVLFIDKPGAGSAVVLATAKSVAAALLATAAAGALLRSVHFLELDDWDQPTLAFGSL